MPSLRTTTTHVFTDGACEGNPGPGGWAFVVNGGRWQSVAAAYSTNQQMELTAAYEAIKALPGNVTVHSDSKYVVDCFNDGWWEGWLRRGWCNSQKKPVANRELWEPFIALVRGRRAGGDTLRFEWVKGHSGDPMNDAADSLATTVARLQHGGSSGDYFTFAITGAVG